MDKNAPADTTMMGVAHDALRRDLDRLKDTIGGSGPLPDEQRIALADHATWLMNYLHKHHVTEDTGLWPQVRERNPQAAPLLDEMDAEHAGLTPAIDGITSAAAAYRADPGQRQRMLDELAAASEPLLFHLRHEEDEAMPVVSATLTNRQFLSWYRRSYVIRTAPPVLAIEVNWLLDSLDQRRAAFFRSIMPPPARLFLQAFRGRYRRQCAARWGAGVPVGPR